MAQASILVRKNELLYGLKTVQRATLPLHRIVPLSNVLITSDERGLKISASDMLFAVTTWVPATAVEGSLHVNVSFMSLLNCVEKLQPGNILVQQVPETPAIRIHSGQYDVRIMGTDVREFPPMPMASDQQAPERITGYMRVNTLRDVADKVAIAAAVGDIRVELTGVRIESRWVKSNIRRYRRVSPRNL